MAAQPRMQVRVHISLNTGELPDLSVAARECERCECYYAIALLRALINGRATGVCKGGLRKAAVIACAALAKRMRSLHHVQPQSQVQVQS